MQDHRFTRVRDLGLALVRLSLHAAQCVFAGAHDLETMSRDNWDYCVICAAPSYKENSAILSVLCACLAPLTASATSANPRATTRAGGDKGGLRIVRDPTENS